MSSWLQKAAAGLPLKLTPSSNEQRRSRSLAQIGPRPCRRPKNELPRRPHALELGFAVSQHPSDRTDTPYTIAAVVLLR